MDKKLIIVGNGFDLNLGLPTSYSDFVQSELFQNICNKNRLCNYLNNLYLKHNWVDIELALKYYAKETTDKYSFYSEYIELKRTLTTYLQDIDLSIINKKSVAYDFVLKYCYECFRLYKSNYIVFLNFNYTNSVNYVIDSNYMKLGSVINFLGTKPFKSFHIHGDIKKDNIILGVEETANLPKDYSFLKKTHSKEYLSLKNSFSQFDEIFIFGHSIGKTDEDFFIPLFLCPLQNKKHPKRITIYYKEEQNYIEYINRINEMTNNQLALLRDKIQLEFKAASKAQNLQDLTAKEIFEELLILVGNISKICEPIISVLSKK